MKYNCMVSLAASRGIAGFEVVVHASVRCWMWSIDNVWAALWILSELFLSSFVK